MSDANAAPLAGLRVLEWSLYGVGPYAGTLLAALGADVVKVEPPGGDPQRRVPPLKQGVSSLYYYFNNYKRVLTLDLRSAADGERMWSMIERADVLLSNFRPSAPTRLGFPLEHLHERNEGLVVCNCSAWGDTGPMLDTGGSDSYVQAFSGWCEANAEGARELQRCLGHIDINASHFLVASILSAVLARRRRATAAIHVRMSMLESILALECLELCRRSWPEPLNGDGSQDGAWRGLEGWYECLDGQAIAIGLPTASIAYTFLECALGEADRERAESALAQGDVSTTRAAVAAALAERPSYISLSVLQRKGVPAVRPWDAEAARWHPQSRANNLFGSAELEHGESILLPRPPWRLEPAPIRDDCALPLEDTVEAVLARWPARPEEAAASTAAGEPADDELAPLRDTSVVDLWTGIAGSFCGRLLMQNGARVMRYDPPEAVDGEALVPSDCWYLNRDKDAGEPALRRSLAGADIILVDRATLRSGRPGLSLAELRGANASAVICVFSAYGEQGPLADLPTSEVAVEGLLSAWGGLGAPERPSRPTRVPQALLTAGITGYQAIVASLLSGVPQVAHVDALSGLLSIRGQFWSMTDAPDDWPGRHLRAPYDPQNFGYQTADAPVLFNVNRKLYRHVDPETFGDLLSALGVELPDGLDPNATLGSPGDPRVPRWKPFWEQAFRRFGADELARIFDEHGGEAIPMMSLRDVIESEQVRALDVIEHVDVGDRAVVQTRCPWRLVAAAPLTTPGG